MGTIWLYYGTAAPAGWLFCDGGSTTGYAALAAIVGATVPDMRGRAPMTAGAGTGLVAKTLGTQYGAETVTLAIANLPSHSHGGGAAHTHTGGYHTHTGGNHGHNGNSHAHDASHGHIGHAHSGIVHVGTGSGHDHWGQWGQTAGNPGGYFTGQYANTANAWSGAGGGAIGPSVMTAEAPETGGPNSSGNMGSSGTIISLEGSATPVGISPPGLALQFIIKT